jgi:MoxR-like ATPase
LFDKPNQNLASAAAIAERLLNNLELVVLGKRKEQQLALMTLMCKGHLLIEDVPGVGKTTLAKSIAKSVGCSFRRIQFTPDLLPTDITGASIFNQRTSEFEFRPGPIVSQIVLADEINRASPKTQAALLESMEERQLTVDGITHPMPKPFMVMATQNPIEYEGTFPLPETELDRFMLRLRLGYPSFEDEIAVLESQRYVHPIDDLQQVVTNAELTQIQDAVQDVEVERPIREYIVRIVESTRRHPNLYLGASPRGSLTLFRLAQASALLEGREFAIPDDVKVVAEPALAHRLILSSSARIQGSTAAGAVTEILEEVAVPGAIPG